MGLMFFVFEISYLLVLALAVPAAGFLVRTFIVFHECYSWLVRTLEACECRARRCTGRRPLYAVRVVANTGA
jgi:hypothetical protein